MDAELKRRWNEVVKPDDTVYHLGDVCMRKHQTEYWGRELNGNKILVLGNHDRSFVFMERAGWQCSITRRGEEWRFHERDREFRVAHRPRDLATWTEEDKAIVLCGHEHSNMPQFIKWVRQKNDKPRPVMALNCCVEHWSYQPVPLRTIIETYDKYMENFR